MKDSFKDSFVKDPFVKDSFKDSLVKTSGFTVSSLKNVAKPVALLCFPSKMLKNHWLYSVHFDF